MGSSPERTQEQRKALGIERGYGSLEELAGDTSLDVVHICTPNHLHFGEAEAALKAKKHVLCEKPLGMNSRETAALVDLARSERRAGAVAHNLRYYPMCQEARALVRRGAIGEPRMVHGSYLQDWLLYPSDWNWRLEPAVSGSMRTAQALLGFWLVTKAKKNLWNFVVFPTGIDFCWIVCPDAIPIGDGVRIPLGRFGKSPVFRFCVPRITLQETFDIAQIP